MRLELGAVEPADLRQGGGHVGERAVEGEALGIHLGAVARGDHDRLADVLGAQHGGLERGARLGVEGDRLEEGERGAVVRQPEDDEAHDDAPSGTATFWPWKARICSSVDRSTLRTTTPSGTASTAGAKLRTERTPAATRSSQACWAPSDGVAMTPMARPSSADEAGQVGHRPHRLAGDPLADQAGVAVEQGDDPEAALGEPAVGRERPAEVAHADDGDRPVLGEPEHGGDLGGEALDVVADAAHAVGPEVGQVLAEHRGADAGGRRELLGAHRRDAVTGEGGQRPEVAGETGHRGVRDAPARGRCGGHGRSPTPFADPAAPVGRDGLAVSRPGRG